MPTAIQKRCKQCLPWCACATSGWYWAPPAMCLNNRSGVSTWVEGTNNWTWAYNRLRIVQGRCGFKPWFLSPEPAKVWSGLCFKFRSVPIPINHPWHQTLLSIMQICLNTRLQFWGHFSQIKIHWITLYLLLSRPAPNSSLTLRFPKYLKNNLKIRDGPSWAKFFCQNIDLSGKICNDHAVTTYIQSEEGGKGP